MPSTSFKIRGQELIVDVLAPMRGRETARPVQLTDFDTYASPLRDLEFLLQDVQPVVLLFRHGIMVNVPAPGRFAIHKCVVSQKRPAALATKALKDRRQAEQLFRVLLEDRPADIVLAYDAARTQGDAFISKFERGLELLPRDVADAVTVICAS
jgi:hypothetical protein